MTRKGTAQDDRPRPADATADGSRLCLACGLCCQGALHDHVVLPRSEAEPARRLGLAVRAEGSGWVFEVPCPRHRENRCAVYDRRPSPCRTYRCKLLKRYLRGEIDFAASLERVEEVRQHLAGLRRRIGGRDDRTVWQQLGDVLPAAAGAGGDGRELMLDVAVLQALCRRHFKNRAQPAPGLPVEAG